MDATYTPPAGQAECPFCGALVLAMVASATLWMAALFFRCPTCGRRWSEHRLLGEPILRAWTPPAEVR